MDVLEYTAQRFVLVHKRTLSLMFGFTLLGAGVVMFGFIKINPAYPWLGLPLFLVGIIMLLTSAPQSYVTFDKVLGKMEIQRRWVYFKRQLTQFPLEAVSGVRTVIHEKDKTRFRVEIEAENTWYPLTEMWLNDSNDRETLEDRVRSYLEG